MSDPRNATADEFNQHDSELMQRPYEFFDRVRESGCPVAHSKELGGFYYTTNYAATRRVYDDFRTFSSSDGTALPKQPLPLYPIDLDPPAQTRHRKVLNPIFTPEAVKQHKARFEEVINELIDGFVGRGEAELQEDLVRPTLATIIIPFLGVPMEDRDKLAHWLDYLTRRRADDPETCARYGEELGAYLLEFIALRRNSPPREDLMQVLIDADVNGEKLTDMELLGTATLVLFGGLDTTSAALGKALWYLIENPEDARKLLEGEMDFDVALHEFVRVASPIQGLRRTVTKDTVLEGCPLKAGDFVMAMNGAANHDPDQFSDPDEVRFDRAPRNEHEHLGFGGGAHICLGQHFAKLLMRTLITAVLTRLPDLEIAPGFEPEYAVGESRVLKKLPVRFRVPADAETATVSAA